MNRNSSLARINDFMHAVVISGALAISALGLSDELFSSREGPLAVVASAVTGASLAYAATVSQPSEETVKSAPVCRRADLETISL